jgi:hypothetical protein
MPSPQVVSPVHLTKAEAEVILRIRQIPHGSITIKIQDGEPVFLQKIVEDVKLV